MNWKLFSLNKMKRGKVVRALVVILSVFCVSNVNGNTSLKKRVNTLETRVNSMQIRVNTDNELARTTFAAIEQDIESLNTSLVLLEDQVCPTDGSVENFRKVNPGPAQSVLNADVLHPRKAIFAVGFADEKKWLRDKVEKFENEIRENASVIKSEIGGYKTEINALLAVRAKEVEDKLRNHKNDTTDKLKSFENVIDDITSRLNAYETLRTVTEEKIKKDVSLFITDIKAAFNSEVKKLEESFNSIILELVFGPSCSDGWTSFGSFCYLYVSDPQTYHSARDACSALGATVADIENQIENDFLFKLCAKKGHEWNGSFEQMLWVGLTDEATVDNWISDRTESSVIYTNWRDIQPDGGTRQNCVVMGHKDPYDKWNDYTCTTNSRFVCKKHKTEL